MNRRVMLVMKQVVKLCYYSLIRIGLAVLKHIDTKIGCVIMPLLKHWYGMEQ